MGKLSFCFVIVNIGSLSYGANTANPQEAVEKKYSRWVQNATVIYVYNAKGTLQMSVPITPGATVFDIRRYLIDECVTTHNTLYSLSPLYNWLRPQLLWNYSTEKIDRGSIKDAMQQYNTQSFWIQRKQRKIVRIESDNE